MIDTGIVTSNAEVTGMPTKYYLVADRATVFVAGCNMSLCGFMSRLAPLSHLGDGITPNLRGRESLVLQKQVSK